MLLNFNMYHGTMVHVTKRVPVSSICYGTATKDTFLQSPELLYQMPWIISAYHMHRTGSSKALIKGMDKKQWQLICVVRERYLDADGHDWLRRTEESVNYSDPQVSKQSKLQCTSIHFTSSHLYIELVDVIKKVSDTVLALSAMKEHEFDIACR